MNTHLKTSHGIGATLLFLLIQMLFTLHTSAETDPVTSFWNHCNDADHTQLNHSQWQAFLDRYLHHAQDGRTLVDYKNVTVSSAAGVENYINALAQLNPRELNRSEQMAYWINLYNALTVKVVLENPDKASITKMGAGLFSFGPWNDDLLTIASQNLSLNDIEHRILRPIWKDERVHFALNCASIGCPNLAPTVFRSNDLDESLDTARNDYLTHARAVNFDASGVLHVSSIFEWYLEDFAKNEMLLLNYLADNQPNLRSRLLSYTGSISYEYNWDLNSFTGITINHVPE